MFAAEFVHQVNEVLRVNSQNQVINNQEMLKKKIQLVEALADVEIAAKIIKDAEGGGDSNRIDESYKKLNTEMKPVDQGTEEWELVQK